MDETTHRTAQQLAVEISRLRDRPAPQEIESVRRRMQRLWRMIDNAYTDDVCAAAGPGEKCDACGRRYRAVYRVPNDVWAQIAPKKDELGEYPEHQFGGLLCVDCAWRAANEQGITLYFEGMPGGWMSETLRRPLREGSEHLTVDGRFQSDKYPWCAAGFVPLKTSDPMANDLLLTYARRRARIDMEFAVDLIEATVTDGPGTGHEH